MVRPRIKIIVVPEHHAVTKHISLPTWMIRFGLFVGAFVFILGIWIFVDYVHLRGLKTEYRQTLAENQHLKGEARVLIQNLDKVKKSLRRVQDYTTKLGEIVNINVNRVSEKTGIGPLTEEEYSIHSRQRDEKAGRATHSFIPLGIQIKNLEFRPVLEKISLIDNQSRRQAVELQHLLSTLSQKKSLLSSIPSISPVQGWVTSGFGMRISPFTGKRTMHKAIDVAAPVGTPILAPADGVVIFSGKKVGFGNFVMIAHYGYGIVSRYGHNAQNMVQPGQKVRRGEQIATVGMTGRTTGPHLHYEVWVNGSAVDPKKFILDSQLDFF
ncbi:MAG: M23 family metallopeptidase [Zetaproteobacteria bacterium]|nr:M23 family metallopeptidase [Zetaproteobacteria bacterium]